MDPNTPCTNVEATTATLTALRSSSIPLPQPELSVKFRKDLNGSDIKTQLNAGGKAVGS